MKISKNKKMRFFLMSQGSLNPKIRFLGQKVCPVAREQTDTKVFQEFFLQPIIKHQPNNKNNFNDKLQQKPPPKRFARMTNFRFP